MNLPTLSTVVAGFGMLATCGQAALAAEAVAHRLYEVTTQTGMPNLEDNLRYAVVTEKRCLNIQDLSGVFWMLRDVSLQDCRLVKTTGSAIEPALDSTFESTYLLQCHGGHGTTGIATWQLGPAAIAGTLNVRLGGKNMTFFQRITAKQIGRCG